MSVTALPASALALLRRGAPSPRGGKRFAIFPGTPVSWQPGEGADVVPFPPAGRNVSAIVTAPGVSLMDIAATIAPAFWPDASSAFVPPLATAILVRSDRLGYVPAADGGPALLQGWYVGARVILPLDYSADRTVVTVAPQRAVEAIFTANPGLRPRLDVKTTPRPPLAASYGKADLIPLAQRNAADAADLLKRLLQGAPIDRAGMVLDFFNLESTPDLEHLWATTDGRAVMKQLAAVLQGGLSADMLRRAAPPEGGADRSLFMDPRYWAEAVERARFMVTWFRTGNLPPNFVLSPALSSLDLLPPDQRDRFKDFAWARNDYPGKRPAGPNEARANEMARALNDIRPDRRANTGRDAVVSESEFSSKLAYINAELRPVPDFTADAQTQGVSQPRGQQINRQALASFLTMRDAAWADGVPLIVLAGFRTAATAAANATRSGNSFAVASFSSHMLGVAVDLQMSVKSGVGKITQDQTSLEMTTEPMQNVVDMRKSPVHKWMFINGEDFGWYPYQNEPWHWEYNPPGFRELFHP